MSVRRLEHFHGVGVELVVYEVPVDFVPGSLDVAVEGDGHMEDDFLYASTSRRLALARGAAAVIWPVFGTARIAFRGPLSPVPRRSDRVDGLPTGRPLQLDNISLGISDIDGRTSALRTIAQGDRANLDAVRLKFPADALIVEGFDPQAEMIQVPSLSSGSRATGFAKFAINGNEIQNRPASAQLNQPDLVLALLDRAPESPAVEAKHFFNVDDAQYKMVDFANSDHRTGRVGELGCRVSANRRDAPAMANASLSRLRATVGIRCPPTGETRSHATDSRCP